MFHPFCLFILLCIMMMNPSSSFLFKRVGAANGRWGKASSCLLKDFLFMTPGTPVTQLQNFCQTRHCALNLAAAQLLCPRSDIVNFNLYIQSEMFRMSKGIQVQLDHTSTCCQF